jgi:hypothetical protein
MGDSFVVLDIHKHYQFGLLSDTYSMRVQGPKTFLDRLRDVMARHGLSNDLIPNKETNLPVSEDQLLTWIESSGWKMIHFSCSRYDCTLLHSYVFQESDGILK